MERLKELAEMLTGEYREFDHKIKNFEEIAEKEGIVIVYGASDDLCEFRGAIYDEMGCWGGDTFYLTEDGKLHDDMPKTNHRYIQADWCKGDFSWTYQTDIPHENFEIYERGDKYCKGFVFYLKEAVEPLIKLCGNGEPMAQKICRNETENDEVDEFVCSACGLILQEFQEVRVDEDDGEETRHQFIIRYCPQCGAKVVDDD